MNIYTLDDDVQVLRILKKIIEDRKLGNLVGSSASPLDAEKEIVRLQPDLVLIDLLMPEKDGLFMVKELKTAYPSMEFVMISQVSSKEMVGRAYSYGVEYYIHKPVNALEVESILNKIRGRIEISKTVLDIKCTFDQTNNTATAGNCKDMKAYAYLKVIKNVLIQLGIMGEKGSQDIVQLCKYMIENEIDLSEVTLRELCHNLSYKPKSVEQRMRRTVFLAMSNLAHLGIEDYMNETFVEFSNRLFNFEQVRKQMDHIRGKSSKEGTVTIKKFLVGLMLYCENKVK